MAAKSRRASRQLIATAAVGDASALAKLYDEHAEPLYELALRLTESPPDSRDIVHDIFVGLPDALKTFSDEGRFDAWLRQLTARTALALLRHQRSRREVALDKLNDLLHLSPTPPVVDWVSMERAVSELPERFRLVVVLKEVEGYSHKEVAALLGIRPDTSMRYLCTARKMLYEMMEDSS